MGESHGWVYFIADTPSKKNLHKDVPLVGTSSYRTFTSWLADLDINLNRIKIFNQSDAPFSGTSARFLKQGNIKVVALGKKAMQYLLECDIDEFYVLPHPSGLNRQLNDKKKVKEILGACRKFIYTKD